MDKTQAQVAAQREANINTLRSLHNNNVELRHRVDGKSMWFPADQYPDGLENSGYNPNDWVLASEFEGPEGPDHATEVDVNKHPGFEGTGQKIGTHLGSTAEERAAKGDTSAERTLGHIPPQDLEADKEAKPGTTAAEVTEKQQSGQTDPQPGQNKPAPNASDKVAAEQAKK